MSNIVKVILVYDLENVCCNSYSLISLQVCAPS